jgi:hypothetical protein
MVPLWSFIVIVILIVILLTLFMYGIIINRKQTFCVNDPSPRCWSDWVCPVWWDNTVDTIPTEGWPVGLDPSGIVVGDVVYMSKINEGLRDNCAPTHLCTSVGSGCTQAMVDAKESIPDPIKCPCQSTFKPIDPGYSVLGSKTIGADTDKSTMCNDSYIPPTTVDTSQPAFH